MKRYHVLLAICLVATASAQNRIVNTASTATTHVFVDVASGTSVSTITLGTTIEWHYVPGPNGGGHNLVDSICPTGLGAVFTSPLDSTTPVFTNSGIRTDAAALRSRARCSPNG